MRTDKAFKAGLKTRSLYDYTAKGVGAVEDENRQPLCGSGFQAVEHCGLERVIATTHVLQIDDESINTAELLGRGPQTLSLVPI
jgi:hypothetical protein